MSVYNLLRYFYGLLEGVWLASRQAAVMCSLACNGLVRANSPVEGSGDAPSLGAVSLFRQKKGFRSAREEQGDRLER